jgi:hypothetical protein
VISFPLNNVPTLFIQGFTADDVQTILEFARRASSERSDHDNTILFIDTPPTVRTIEAIHKLTDEGYRVIFRDHHGCDGEPADEGDRQRIKAAAKLEKLLGSDCTISVRSLHPACSTLVDVGEFKHATAIVADPDADGLTAAMKAAGIFYPELDEDAAKLDSEPSVQVTGSPISSLLAKGIATLPSYDPKLPKQREQAQSKLFAQWVRAVQGDAKAMTAFEEIVSAYDSATVSSRQIAVTAKEVAPGVMLANVVDAPPFDVGTLLSELEQKPGCLLTVIRKDKGPIAALHGIQYSISVRKSEQNRINLKHLLAPHLRSDPNAGVISNVSFVLHVSEDVWHEYILPALRAPDVFKKAN